MLRWPHDRHRDVRTWLSAQVCSGDDQDRHLMTPSPSIDNRTRTNRSRRRSTGNARARAGGSFCALGPRKHRFLSSRSPVSRRTPRQNNSPKPCNRNSSSRPPRPEPHSARGTATGAHRDFVPWRFWSPVASARQLRSHVGDQKPAQERPQGSAAMPPVTPTSLRSPIDLARRLPDSIGVLAL